MQDYEEVPQPSIEEIEQMRVWNAQECLVYGDIVAKQTFRASPGPAAAAGTRHIAVAKSPLDDIYVMVCEQDGAVATDVLEKNRVAPSGNHDDFRLHQFPDGVVVYVAGADVVPEDEEARQAYFDEAMATQAEFLEHMEDQYFEMVAEDYPGEPLTAWEGGPPYSIERHLLRRWGDVTTAEKYGVRYFYFEGEQRWHSAVELPTPKIRRNYEDWMDFQDFGMTPLTSASLQRDHWVEYKYRSRDSLSESDVVAHMEQVAGQVRVKAERADLSIERFDG